MIRFSKKTRKKTIAFMLSLSMTAAFPAAVHAISIFGKGNEAYTDSMELILASLVPEEGLTIKGRTYSYEDVLDFLDEVRWAPDDYVHKDHHCALSEMPEEDVKSIVQMLRFIMDCPTTYTDVKIVAEVQQKLNDEGFDCGEVDGLLGPLTYGALNKYQEEHELRVINAVTEELLEDMGFEVPETEEAP